MKLHGVARVAEMAHSRVLFYRFHYRGTRRLATLALTPGWLLVACASTMVGSAPLGLRLRTSAALVWGIFKGYGACLSRS
jgi:hypothetical protein